MNLNKAGVLLKRASWVSYNIQSITLSHSDPYKTCKAHVPLQIGCFLKGRANGVIGAEALQTVRVPIEIDGLEGQRALGGHCL